MSQEFEIKNCLIKIYHLGTQQDKEAFCKALVDFLEPYKKELNEKDVERLRKNPLRILDSKNTETQNLLKKAPSIKDVIDKSAMNVLNSIKKQFSDICDIEIDHSLVRGLDYYSGFVFEAISFELGAQDSFLAGGRYDHLFSNLVGKEIPAIRMALCLEGWPNVVTLANNESKVVEFIILSSNL